MHSAQIEAIKQNIIPAIIGTDVEIGLYGPQDTIATLFSEFTSLLNATPLNKLSSCVDQIASRIKEANPRILTAKYNWLSRLTGKNILAATSYHLACKKLDELIVEGMTAAIDVKATVDFISKCQKNTEEYIANLAEYIEAGEQYLVEQNFPSNPQSDDNNNSSISRFEKRLIDLKIIETSCQITVRQYELAKKNAISLLDVLFMSQELTINLWRNNTIGHSLQTQFDASSIDQSINFHEKAVLKLANRINAK